MPQFVGLKKWELTCISKSLVWQHQRNRHSDQHLYKCQMWNSVLMRILVRNIYVCGYRLLIVRPSNIINSLYLYHDLFLLLLYYLIEGRIFSPNDKKIPAKAGRKLHIWNQIFVSFAFFHSWKISIHLWTYAFIEIRLYISFERKKPIWVDVFVQIQIIL